MQKQVTDYLRDRSLALDAALRYIDLVSEVGELGKALLAGSDYGASPLAANDETHLEIGDALFSLLALCAALDIDAQTALDAAIAKYERRWLARGAIGSAPGDTSSPPDVP